MIKFKHKGNFNKSEKFFENAMFNKHLRIFQKYGRQGVEALASATPVDSGETARSWNYEITSTKEGIKIAWTNTNNIEGVPLAILIQYGHATRNGGYVQGRDFINPAIRPIFDKISDDIWREVRR